jgi:phosphoglycerate dehydrogenase-like enzyme
LKVVIGVELDAAQVARIKREFPGVEFVEAVGREKLDTSVADCEVIYGGHPKADTVTAATKLRWVQAFSAGVNHFPMKELAERGIPLTNASGAHGIPIAENILAMMLAFAIRIPTFIRAQDKREWLGWRDSEGKFELEGQTLLVAGLGGIGRTLAHKANALGMRVIGIRRDSAEQTPGVDRTYPAERLREALSEADHIALCLPLTEETTSFLGEPELRSMKSTAYVYNVGRGKSIDRNALIQALQEGWIAGAGLDVTDPEPLPPEDPLWAFPNVILSQHTSGNSPVMDQRVTDIFLDNLSRFLNGEPLRNLVDYDRGY